MDFDNILGGKTANELLDDLISERNVYLKTRLVIPQVKTLTILKWHIEVAKDENKNTNPMILLAKTLDYYLGLLLSLKGESRKEIIEGILGSQVNIKEVPQLPIK